MKNRDDKDKMRHNREILWISGTQYEKRIEAFLNEIDSIIIPKLSLRVNISDYSKKLAEKAETLFVVENNCDIASCSIYCNTETAFISSLAVKKEFFRQQVGTILLNEVKRYVQIKGCSKMQLEVSAQNDTAFGFYKKNGFILVKEENGWKTMEYYL